MIVSIEKPEESDISKVYLMLGPACNLKCRHCYQTDVPMPRLHKTIHEDVWKFLKEALQKPPLPSRMEQKCSVRLFLTTPECAVFLPIQ